MQAEILHKKYLKNKIKRFTYIECRTGLKFSFILYSILGLVCTFQTANAQNTWADFENNRVIISHIDIHVLPVFDMQNPEENHFIGRWANFIHIDTREKSIRPALLFKEGDSTSVMRIRASERLLRQLPFIRDAEIIPLENPDGTVTAVVNVHDAWSLKLSLALRHVGGESEWSAMLREYNILGSGKQIQIGYAKTLDRSLTELAFQDPFFFDSRWIFFSEYKQLSDGHTFGGMLRRPFYDVQTPWAAGMEVNSGTSILTMYENSRPVYNLEYSQSSLSLFYHFLIWQHNRTAQRIGLEGRITGYRYRFLRQFQPDVLPLFENQKRLFHGLLGFWQLYQDNFISRRNIDYMDKVEDFNLGWDAQLRLGYYPKITRGSGKAFYTEGSLARGIAFDDKNFLSGIIFWRSLSEAAGTKHLWSQSSIRFFDQHLPRQTVMISFNYTHSIHPLPEDITYLGGSNGLRGYTNHYRSGDQSWMLTIEDRVFTSWNILGLVKLGFVSYLDVGAIKELSSGRWSKPYASLGAGLRIGNLKSSFGRVISLTVATPLVRETGLKNIQINLGTGL